MFSRLASRHALAPRAISATICVRPIQTSALAKANEERDLVNFPRRIPLEHPPPIQFALIPDSWCKFVYPKIGVTGPLMLLVGSSTFLISKEIYVLNQDAAIGLALIGLVSLLMNKFGADVAQNLDEGADEENAGWSSLKANGIKNQVDGIAAEKLSQWQVEGGNMLFDVKKENVQIQLEAEYRGRLVQVHNEVKKKLDYQVEIINVKNRVEQKHMADWIIDSVRANITPSQEAAALKKCFVDLKVLAKAV